MTSTNTNILLMLGVGVATVYAVTSLFGSKPSGAAPSENSNAAPIEVKATLTQDGLPVLAFDRMWRYNGYADLTQWASAVITQIDQYLPPGSTLKIYRPNESYRPATDALKAARRALPPSSTWVLSLRDVEG